MFKDHRIFFREFLNNFHTTGAVAPSGAGLSKALTRYVLGGSQARTILEVGPGTGAVTRWIVQRLGPLDQLEIVELNERFAQHLEERFTADPPFRKVAERAKVLNQSVEDLPQGRSYDIIISGLPLNNFDVPTVERLLDVLLSRLSPGGILSFFEYVGIRRLKALTVRPAERERLAGISRCMQRAISSFEVARDFAWLNVPPACVHHLQAKWGTASQEMG